MGCLEQPPTSKTANEAESTRPHAVCVRVWPIVFNRLSDQHKKRDDRVVDARGEAVDFVCMCSE